MALPDWQKASRLSRKIRGASGLFVELARVGPSREFKPPPFSSYCCIYIYICTCICICKVSRRQLFSLPWGFGLRAEGAIGEFGVWNGSSQETWRSGSRLYLQTSCS